MRNIFLHEINNLGSMDLHNVQFVRCGQEGFTEGHDARFPVSFIDTGTSGGIRISQVKGCSFYHSYSSAIGLYGANNITISDNVIHRTVGTGE